MPELLESMWVDSSVVKGYRNDFTLFGRIKNLKSNEEIKIIATPTY
jgi:hypothetical protein